MAFQEISTRVLEQVEAARKAIETEFAEDTQHRLFWLKFLNECVRLITNNELSLPEHREKRNILEARGVNPLDNETSDKLTDFVLTMRRVYDAFNKRKPNPYDEDGMVEVAMAHFLPFKIYEELGKFWITVYQELSTSFPESAEKGIFQAEDDSELRDMTEKMWTFKARKSAITELFKIEPSTWMLTAEKYGLVSDIPLFGDYCMIVKSESGLQPMAVTIKFASDKRIIFPYMHILGEAKSGENYSNHEALTQMLDLAQYLKMEAIYLGELGQGRMNFEELILKE